MSAQPFQSPPQREVFNRSDVEDVARRLQKRRFATFLSAKHILETRLRDGAAAVAQLAEKLHCGGAVRMAARVCGWLVGGLGLLRKAVRVSGVLAGAAWLLTTPVGGKFITKTAGVVVSAVRHVGSALARAGSWFLGLFGKRGAQVGTKVEALATSVVSWVGAKVNAARVVVRAVVPVGLVARLVRTVALERVLKVVLDRFLSRGWSMVARVALNTAMLPLSLARSLFGDEAPSTPVQAPGTGPNLRDVSTPAASPAPTVVVGPAGTTVRPTDDELADVEPNVRLGRTGTDDGFQEQLPIRYPTRRSPHAKKRK